MYFKISNEINAGGPVSYCQIPYLFASPQFSRFDASKNIALTALFFVVTGAEDFIRQVRNNAFRHWKKGDVFCQIVL